MFRSTHAHTQTALCKAVQFREIRGRCFGFCTACVFNIPPFWVCVYRAPAITVEGSTRAPRFSETSGPSTYVRQFRSWQRHGHREAERWLLSSGAQVSFRV